MYDHVYVLIHGLSLSHTHIYIYIYIYHVKFYILKVRNNLNAIKFKK